jgi:hypothetical protein
MLRVANVRPQALSMGSTPAGPPGRRMAVLRIWTNLAVRISYPPGFAVDSFAVEIQGTPASSFTAYGCDNLRIRQRDCPCI